MPDEKRPLHSIYKDNFFRKRGSLHWRAPIFCGAVEDVFHPISVLDVGCATGDLVKQFRDMKIISDGVEGSSHAVKYAVISDMHVLDLREDQTIQKDEVENFVYWEDSQPKYDGIQVRLNDTHYDLVCCLEVAEHIEPEYTNMFLKNITHWSNQILMSIAPPGQKGTYHVNLQEMEYWDELMFDLDYVRHQVYAHQIKNKIYDYRNRQGISAFYNNLVYYQKRR